MNAKVKASKTSYLNTNNDENTVSKYRKIPKMSPMTLHEGCE